MTDSEPRPAGSSEKETVAKGLNSPPAPPERGKNRLKRLGLAALALVVIGGAGMVGAEYYTGQPDFCGSCHIMDPYYDSWALDVHGSRQIARCVDCHYAPGEQHTLKAKFKGLSQLASYFSGRAGGGRPRAHVADASCLTSACHGDGSFMSARLMMSEPRMEKRLVGGQEIEVQRTPTVGFNHEKHLRPEKTLNETRSGIEQTAARLARSIPADVYRRLNEAIRRPGPAGERLAAIRAITGEAHLSPEAETDAIELGRLHRLRMRLEQLEGIKCATCHTYNAEGTTHVIADRQVCYICHFTHQGFNEDTGTCLRCHEAPTRKIAMHEPSAGSAGVTTLMEHQEVVQRNIPCASCHLDVIQGDNRVTERDCTTCHDQSRYLARFSTRTVEDVEEYHRVHVSGQRARCADCHHGIRHELIEPTAVATSWGFVQPVLENCRHCHPNHHHEQVALLMGTGGLGVPDAMPNAMFGSRMNCQACHTQSGTDFHGAPLIKATADTCVACHSEEYRGKLDQWIHELAARLTETSESFAVLTAGIDERRRQGRAVPEAAEDLLVKIRHDLSLVRLGGGVHNKNYALSLLDFCDRSIRQVQAMLDGP